MGFRYFNIDDYLDEDLRGLEGSLGFVLNLNKGEGTARLPPNTVRVTNPKNPRELIVVPAVRNANGDLVPADPRYNVRLGSETPVDLKPTNWLTIGGGALVLVLVAKLFQ